MTRNSNTVISPQIIDHRDFFFSALIIAGNLFPLPHLLKFFRDNNFLKLRKLTSQIREQMLVPDLYVFKLKFEIPQQPIKME